MKRGAILSECGTYRYTLTRVWDENLPLLGFIMLNPSTADAYSDDQTIRKCIKYAKREKCGGIIVCNLFAYRTTDPARLKTAYDPIGEENDNYLMYLAQTDKIVAAWGNHGSLHERDKEVLKLFKGKTLYCLNITASGQPVHPLYQKDNQPLECYPIKNVCSACNGTGKKSERQTCQSCGGEGSYG